VPNLVGKKVEAAATAWAGAGFTGTVIDGGGNGSKIDTQSHPAGSSRSCSSDITVYR
jgi:hypothetical protein